MVQCSCHMVRREQMLAAVVEEKLTCQTMLLQTFNSSFFYEWKKERKFKNLKAKMPILTPAKISYSLGKSEAPIFFMVFIKTSHKCEGNAKSHPTEICRKQSYWWMVWTGHDTINQRTAESSYRLCWIGWRRLFFYGFLLLYDLKICVRPSQVTEHIRLLLLSRPSIRLSHFDQDNVTWSCLFKVFSPLC